MVDASPDLTSAPERLRGWARTTAALSLTAATVVAAGLFLPSSSGTTTAVVASLAYAAFVLFVASACVWVRAALYNPQASAGEAETNPRMYAAEILPAIRTHLRVGAYLGAAAAVCLVGAVTAGLIVDNDQHLEVHRTGAAPSSCPDLPATFNATTSRQGPDGEGPYIRLEVRARLCGDGQLGQVSIWLPRLSTAIGEQR